jgi:telomere length regulation protein
MEQQDRPAEAQVREIIDHLQSDISDSNRLLSLLASPLEAIGLLPPVFRRYDSYFLNATSKKALSIENQIVRIQFLIVERVAPVWEKNLQDDDLEQILYQYFCPDSIFSAMNVAIEVAMYAYLTLRTSRITQFSIQVLRRLQFIYPLDRLHALMFSDSTPIPSRTRLSVWEDIVRSIISFPTKIVNHKTTLDIPVDLEFSEFMSFLSSRFEKLLAAIQHRVSEGTKNIPHLNESY